MLLINLSDSELVALYLKGDSKSFEALIQKHKNKIYAFIYLKSEIEILQKIFSRILLLK